MKTKLNRLKNCSEMIRTCYGEIVSKALFTDSTRISTDMKNIHIFCNYCASLNSTPYSEEVWKDFKKQLNQDPNPCCPAEYNK